MSDDLEQRAREIVEKMCSGALPNPHAMVNAIADFARTIQAETREADGRMVNGLIGKDSGNWNRAIAYAVEAIRAQGGRDGREGVERNRTSENKNDC